MRLESTVGLVAMIVSVNRSWASKITKKKKMLRLDFLVRILQKTRQFWSEKVLTVFIVFFLISRTRILHVFVILLALVFLWLVFRYPNTNGKIMVVFVAWILQMIFRWKPSLWEVLQSLYLVARMGFDFEPVRGNRARVGDKVTTSWS